MATLPRDAKVEIDAVAIVGQIVDIEDSENEATGIVGNLLLLVLVQGLTIYRIITS